jgi:hypothetical protein
MTASNSSNCQRLLVQSCISRDMPYCNAAQEYRLAKRGECVVSILSLCSGVCITILCGCYCVKHITNQPLCMQGTRGYVSRSCEVFFFVRAFAAQRLFRSAKTDGHGVSRFCTFRMNQVGR